VSLARSLARRWWVLYRSYVGFALSYISALYINDSDLLSSSCSRNIGLGLLHLSKTRSVESAAGLS